MDKKIMAHLILNERVVNMEASATLAMAQAARDLAASGIDVANLSTGEPDFPTPAIIREIAKKTLDQGKTHYVPVRGIKPMIEAMQKKFLRDQKVSYAPDEVMCTVGGKSAIWLALLALVNPGDEVIICAPFWVSYKEQIRLLGGVPKIVQCHAHNNFMPDAHDIARAINKKTKAIIINSPNNPSGGVISQSQLESLAEALRGTDVFLLSDEIYERLLFDGHQHISPASLNADMRERTIVISGVSKAYAMTGFRVGVVAGIKPLIAAMEKLQGQDTTCLPEFIQASAAFALLESEPVQAEIDRMLISYTERRDFGLSLFSRWPKVQVFKPQGAFYLWVDFSAYMGHSIGQQKLNDDVDLATRMLKEAHVSSVPGSSFGAPGYLRFSIASAKDTIEKAYQRVDGWLKEAC